MHTVYLSLGSNIGNRKQAIRDAIKLINLHVGYVKKTSSLYETKPWGYDSPNDYINVAVCVNTKLTPKQVLNTTRKIEISMGRVAKSIAGAYQDRIIDIDILLYDNENINEPELKIPHPLMHERDFVMTPLNEITGKGPHR